MPTAPTWLLAFWLSPDSWNPCGDHQVVELVALAIYLEELQRLFETLPVRIRGRVLQGLEAFLVGRQARRDRHRFLCGSKVVVDDRGQLRALLAEGQPMRPPSLTLIES